MKCSDFMSLASFFIWIGRLSHRLQSDLNDQMFFGSSFVLNCFFQMHHVPPWSESIMIETFFFFLETDSFIIQATMQDLKDCGFDCWETSIGGPGVQQHSPLSVKEDILEILNCHRKPNVTSVSLTHEVSWRKNLSLIHFLSP